MDLNSLHNLILGQAEKIKEMERLIASKASRTELNSGLNIKSNLTDVMRSIEDLCNKIDSKASNDDIIEKGYIDNILFNINENLTGIVNKTNLKLDEEKFISFMNRNDSKLSNIENELNNLRLDIDSKATVEEVNSALNTKASKTTVIEALHRKVNRNEYDDLITKMTKLTSEISGIDNKIDKLESSYDIKLEMKADVNSIKLFPELMKSKVELTDFSEYKIKVQENNIKLDDLQSKLKCLDNEFDNLLNNIKSDMQIINKTLITKSDKIDIMNSNKTLETLEEKVKSIDKQTNNKIKQIEINIDSNINNITEVCNSNVSGFERINKKLSTITKEIEALQKRNSDIETNLKDYFINYVDYDSYNNGMKEIESKLNDFLITMRNNSNGLNEQVMTNKTTLDNFITEIIQEFEEVRKESQNGISELFANHNITKEEYAFLNKKIEENYKLIEKYSNINNILDKKLDNSSFDLYVKSANNTINELMKRNIKSNDLNESNSLINLIKAKADIEDVNKAINSIYTEIDVKCSSNELTSELEKIYSVLDNFNSTLVEFANNKNQIQNNYAKYEAKGSSLKSGLAITWEREIVNTNISLFTYNKNKQSFIEIHESGLYRIIVFIYNSSFPNSSSIQILVNGENYKSSQLKSSIEENIYLSSKYSKLAICLLNDINQSQTSLSGFRASHEQNKAQSDFILSIEKIN